MNSNESYFVYRGEQLFKINNEERTHKKTHENGRLMKFYIAMKVL